MTNAMGIEPIMVLNLDWNLGRFGHILSDLGHIKDIWGRRRRPKPRSPAAATPRKPSTGVRMIPRRTLSFAAARRTWAIWSNIVGETAARAGGEFALPTATPSRIGFATTS